MGHHGHPFARADAQAVETRRLGPGPLGQPGEGQRGPRLGRLVGLVDDGHPVRVGGRGPVEELSDIELDVHGFPLADGLGLQSTQTPGSDRQGEPVRRLARPPRLAKVPPMTPPRVAVGPFPSAFATDAVRDGGGEVVDLDDHPDSLVWLDPADVDGLTAWLAEVPDARWVQLPFAGVEQVAEAGLLDDERIWTCAKGAYAEPVAEHALALALAGLRHLPARVVGPSWGIPAGTSLYDQKVTVLGGGGIATSLLEQLAPFRVEATVVRRRPPTRCRERRGRCRSTGSTRRSVDALVVVLALALTPETTGIIGAPELAAMAESAWLVNVARGRHVDTDALVDALRRRIDRRGGPRRHRPGAAARRAPAVGPRQLHRHAAHGGHHRDGGAAAGRAHPDQRPRAWPTASPWSDGWTPRPGTRRRRRAVAGRRVAVAVAADGLEHVLVLVLPAELAAQAQHGELDPLRADAERVVPHLFEELLGGECLPGVAHEGLEELELELGEADDLAVHPHLAGRPVDLEVAVPVDGRLLGEPGGRGGLAAAQQGLDAGTELLDAERLRQVVVGAAGEAPDLLVLEVVGGQDQHRHLGEVADALEHLPAVHLGQSDVEHDQVRPLLEEVPQADATVARHHARAVLLGHHPSDRLGDRGVVLDDEDPRGAGDLVGAQGCGHRWCSLLCASNPQVGPGTSCPAPEDRTPTGSRSSTSVSAAAAPP